MHIPEGILNPYICVIMYAVAFAFLFWSWRSMKGNSSRAVIPLVAVISAMLLIIQLAEFPVAGGGSTWHFLGGTTISVILGPFPAVISMTITLVIQAMLGDGGITSFGANLFNMAMIGAMSFFIVKVLLSKNFTFKRLALSVFAACCISNTLTGLATGIEIGLYPIAGNLGGLWVSVPTMLLWYVPTGVIEGIVASALLVSLAKAKSVKLLGLELCKNKKEKEIT